MQLPRLGLQDFIEASPTLASTGSTLNHPATLQQHRDTRFGVGKSHAKIMAEAAGLAVGTIALATLFQTCLDILDYIDDARNMDSDRERGESKLGLLKIRLKHWGEDLQVLHPGHEDGGLREHWPEESGTISRSLTGITEILSDASQLCCKYALYKSKAALRHPGLQLSKVEIEQKAAPRGNNYRSLASLKYRATWVFRDKRKLASLLTELDFFITNLERVTTRVWKFHELKLESLPASEEEFNMSKIHTLADLEKGNTTPPVTKDDLGHTLAERMAAKGDVTRKTPDRVAEATRQVDGHKYSGMSVKDNAIQQEGDHGKADPNAKKHEYTGHKAEGHGVQMMGNLDRAASKNLFDVLRQNRSDSSNTS